MKEKNQIEQQAAEKQVTLISEALDQASNTQGYWLNPSGKTYPIIYPKGVAVSPFNALIMALHSDKNGSRSNLFTTFSETKAQGYAVREHEKGVPFIFYNWNRYVNIHNPDDKIYRADYLKLDDAGKKMYKGIHNREIRTLFTLDQTTRPLADKKGYEKTLEHYGTAEDRGMGNADDRKLHIRFNDFLLKMRDNFIPIRTDGTGIAHFETDKDAVYLPRQKDFEQYTDYVQEALRQIISATGHQQRLAREGTEMKNGTGPAEDARKQERLIVELASGVKMMELGLPGRLTGESLKLVDYWKRELQENPNLIDIVESEVNNALKVIEKAELGEKIEYATLRRHQETTEIKEQLPKHYEVVESIKQHPDKENRTIVVVKDPKEKTADVILPEGASLDPEKQDKGLNKQRIRKALEKENIERVLFFNPDGAYGYHPDDSYFANKEISVARLKNWSLEVLSSVDATEAIQKSGSMSFDQIQMIRDDNNRWALYLKPEGKNGYSIYPDKADLNQFFSTLKQSMDNLEKVRMELANKYYALAEHKPELKIDLFKSDVSPEMLNSIERVSLFKTKSGEIRCAATIHGEKQEPRNITSQQWQRMWLCENKDDYKRHLAASLFADILRKGNTQEQQTKEQPTHEEQKESSSILQQYNSLKKKHPDAILLFRRGDFYETYMEDAVKSSEILGITLIKQNGRKDGQGNSMTSAGFPYHSLDTYLPKLIRAGERVAICDFLETSKRQPSINETNEESHSSGIKR